MDAKLPQSKQEFLAVYVNPGVKRQILLQLIIGGFDTRSEGLRTVFNDITTGKIKYVDKILQSQNESE